MHVRHLVQPFFIRSARSFRNSPGVGRKSKWVVNIAPGSIFGGFVDINYLPITSKRRFHSPRLRTRDHFRRELNGYNLRQLRLNHSAPRSETIRREGRKSKWPAPVTPSLIFGGFVDVNHLPLTSKRRFHSPRVSTRDILRRKRIVRHPVHPSFSRSTRSFRNSPGEGSKSVRVAAMVRGSSFGLNRCINLLHTAQSRRVMRDIVRRKLNVRHLVHRYLHAMTEDGPTAQEGARGWNKWQPWHQVRFRCLFCVTTSQPRKIDVFMHRVFWREMCSAGRRTVDIWFN